MYIIIKGKDRNIKRLKGKGISEFARNLESEGWPTEFYNEEIRDRVKFVEKKERRPLRKFDIPKISKEMGIPSKLENIEQIAKEKKLVKFKKGFPK